jgi:ketosteroid isomerase-like protein
MSEQNVEIVRRGYALFAAGDLEGVAALVSPEADVAGGGGLGIGGTMGIRHGPEGMLRAMQEVLEAFEDYRVEVEEIIDAGEVVIAAVLISGRGRTSGLSQQERFAHLWVFRDGKVTHGEVHRTIAEARESARRP